MNQELDLQNNHLNNLDRIKDIFSLIQTNYFLQLEQLEEKSLFLDIDANYIYDSKPNIGAIPFMNKKDERILFFFVIFITFYKF